MGRPFGGWMLLAALAALSACHHTDEAATVGELHREMSAVKQSAEVVLTGKPALTRQSLAQLGSQIAAADRDIAAAEGTASSLTESSNTRATVLGYLKAVRDAVDQSRDRYASAIALEEAKLQDRSVSASFARAQDQATLEQARIEANHKAGALAAAVDHAGNAVVEREQRLDALMTAMLRAARPLSGYPLVSNDALAVAMANNVSAAH